MYFDAPSCLIAVMKRILIYSHDTFGLGNIRRMLEVARHLVQSSPEVSVLVITGSPMLHAFRIPPRVDYVKLPCLARNTEGHYAARYLDLTLDATVRLRANLISSTIEDFAPDLILVDKKPFGVEDEMAGALAAQSERARKPKLMLLLRDILDSPEATTRVWRKNGYFEAIEAYYDAVLVVGSPEVYDLRAEYAFPPFAAAKVQFCGYIAREPGRHSAWPTASRWSWSPPAAAKTATAWSPPASKVCAHCRSPSALALTSSVGPRWARRRERQSCRPAPRCPTSACRTSATT
jgi:predicted glycosyltransferase